MTAKDYLSQIISINEEISDIQDELQGLRDLRESISVTLTVDKIKSSPMLDRLGELTASILDFENKHSDALARLLNAKKEIEGTIETVEDKRLRRLLRLRYVRGLNWEHVAGAMCYSMRQAYRLHKDALPLIEKMSLNVTT